MFPDLRGNRRPFPTLLRLARESPRQGERLKIGLGCRSDLASCSGYSETLFPARSLTTNAFVEVVDDHVLAMRIDHVFPLAGGIHERLAGALKSDSVSFDRALQSALFLGLSVRATTQLMSEVNRATEETTQVVDRSLGEFQMIPCGLDNIGETFAMLTRFAHEFENQEIKETQGP